LENGKNETTLKRLDEILEVLGIDDEDIIDGRFSPLYPTKILLICK